MSFLDRLLRGARERIDLPTLPVPPTLPVIQPLETPLPRQIGGIGSMLPMQTITLPGGQTVQIPEINMDEVNANLLAAGITPQVPVPAVTPPVAKPTTPTQAESIMQYLGEQGELQEGMDVDGDGEVTLLDAVQSLQIDQGLRNADGTAIPQTPAVATPAPVTPTTVAPTISTLDEALTNPRGDFMSIERMPSVDLPVATPAPVVTPDPAVTAPTIADIDPFAFAERTPSADLDFFQTTPVPPTPEELRRQAAVEEAVSSGQPTTDITLVDFGGGFMPPPQAGLELLPQTPPAVTTPDPVVTTPAVTTPAALPAPKPMRPEDASQTNPDGTPYATVGAGFKQNPFEDFKSRAITPPTPAVEPTPVVTPDPVVTPAPAVEQPLAPYTGAQASPEDMPFVPSVRQVATGLDPLTEQLLFGIGGQGGFIPGAMRAAERTFFNPDGTPRVVEEQVAGFTPDQLRAAELARQGVGIQDRFISGAEGAFGSGIDALGRGFGRARGFAGQGLRATRAGLGDLTSGLSEQERISRGATGQFGQRLGGLGRQAMGSTADFGGRLGESESLLRGTTGAYDPSLTSAFFDPFEDRVVQQTISDVLEQGAQADIAARAGDIARGGESAFGSRARLGASERQRALGRGLGEAISGIRSRGFTEAQRTGLSEFARQRAAERAASSGLAGLSAARLGAQQQLGGTLRGLSADQLAAQQGLAGTLGALGSQRFAGQQALAGALTGLGGMESQLAQREQAAQFGLGSALQGLGAQAQGAQATDIAQLYGMGTQQQALSQAQLDAQRRNQLQAQQAPLAQYQALAPFVSMAPAGQFQTVTDFAPPPSAMQVGIGTGLSTLGALGNLYGGG